ncbi:choice-of-anchor L domain-containing protein [Winogradskyella sp. 3972H.M.0a.05]|uniref:T9SS type B sorting domain-containing protein n=1 Tax=Winogradskyella sp. 3972H.M.0a.05 TaxID=2950277 RepID=UPI00339963E8
MKPLNLSLIILLFALGQVVFPQQVSIDNSVSAQDLVQNHLIQGCVEVSNISSSVNGSVDGFGSFGYFDRSNSNFPFENGIILSTGNASSGGNTLNSAVLNEGSDSWGTDPDLETALGLSGTQNATSIEFDVISSTNQIQFNYILASEEYFGNFPCQYSDGFAFLIRETGSNGPYTNIAVVPQTSIPVNTNTIHEEIVGFCAEENGQYFDGYSIGDTNYNGRTVTLTATAPITPDVQYHIKLIIADERDTNYDSAVFIQGNSFSASVDLGDDVSTCADSITLDGNIGNPDATYQWFFNGTEINGATATTFDANASGNYQVVITLPLAGSTCTIEDDVNITLSSTQSMDPISDYELCDDISMDGVEIFDLSTKDEEVFNALPSANYNISYHLLESCALNNTCPITGPIQNVASSQAIFVRVEDVDTGCLAYTSFDIVVNPLPSIIDPTPLIVCDDTNADGITSISLSDKDDEITSGQSNLFVTYHFSQSEADSGVNPISLPYTNTNQTEQLFVRVIDQQTGCASTSLLTVQVLDNPVINTEDLYLDACDQEHDGFATFNLTDAIDDILQGLTGVSITYHETQDDAATGANPIPDPTSYDNAVQDEQIIYVRVVDDLTGCASIAPLEIHSNLLLTATNIRDFSRCDTDNDGTENHDLINIANIIINDLPDPTITVTFYESESDRDNAINPIDISQPYTPSSYPFTLYITISNSTCEEVDEITLDINAITEFEAVGDLQVCDEDQDGFTNIDLSQFDDLVNQGQPGFAVTYFATQADADNNENPLPTVYANPTNPITLYPRIQSTTTGCADSDGAFQLEVLPAPLSSVPSDVIICDNDQDGFSLVDLNTKVIETAPDLTDRTVSFHTSQADADFYTNAISMASPYNAQTETIFVRIENDITGCHSTESFEIIVNTLPVFTAIDSYNICENNSDGVADFVFETKDLEILDGQTGKQVLYYTNQSDADNRVNDIDKTLAYQNISNPQTIFVRVENLTDQDCYGTSSFTIEVGTNPEFNMPADWFVCDDLSNDGSELFDLNLKVQEISQGINDTLDITFHTSQSDAESGNNALPLEFANTVNPQTIYARIDNGTICNSIASFELNVIQSPEVANATSTVTVCDDDFDGIVTVDLTISEIDILDVRQDDIVISYFETIEDLHNDQNAINNPEAYTNLSNPQTVYVKVNNTISNCYVTVLVDIVVNLPPAINDFGTYEICDNEDNSFDLTEINEVVTENTFNILYTYYTNLTDAENAENALNTNYTYQSNNDQLFVRVQYSTTHCYFIYPFTLQVNPNPVANEPNDMEACDDDFDGLLVFDLSTQNDSILGGQNPAIFNVSYYTSVSDAEAGINELPSEYEAIDGEEIIAKVENTNTGCYSLTQFNTIINPRPEVDIPDQVICLDNLPLYVSANTNQPGDTYLWSTNQTTPEIEITEIGNYWVTVTTPLGCVTTEHFAVSESEQATIELTETVDFSDPNNITVTISGIGNYLYILDDGEPQESNVFENVPLGYHTITVIDLNGCAEITKEVVVIDAPKFLTPNNDGYFDTWHITGVETLPGTTIYIFDRYGKQIAFLTSTSRGWDGTYNGYDMPSTDYWFLANVKKDDIEFEVRGHFALRR